MIDKVEGLKNSVAHIHGLNYMVSHLYPDRTVPWCNAQAPDISQGINTGRLVHCNYCGSMHPTDVVEAIKSGAILGLADRKYGWPHKVYLRNIPNPHVGMLESRMSASNPSQESIDSGAMIKQPTGYYNQVSGEPTYTYIEKGKPAEAMTNGKFYTEHLQDATDEEKAIIEKAIGISYLFENGNVHWSPVHD